MKKWHGSGCKFSVDRAPIGRVAWGPDNTDFLQIYINNSCHQLPPPIRVMSEQTAAGIKITLPDIDLSFLSDSQGGTAVLNTIERYNDFVTSKGVLEAPSEPPIDQGKAQRTEDQSSAPKRRSRKTPVSDDGNQLGLEGL
ncbi:hypothetical protein [Marinobacter sp.]|uniref:hypothetical protein n=1 Tax=Marinobacter sp. TaxID=50741 RepID=UPI0035661E95